MISTHTLAVIAILTTTAIIAVSLALASGASWPAALLAALPVVLTVAGLLLRAGRGGGGPGTPSPQL